MADRLKQKKSIRKILLDAGFIEARFSQVSAVGEKHLETWLKKGYQGDMAWLSKNMDIRKDPRLLYVKAKSIISLALPYLSNMPFENKLFGISKYAQGSDYHKIIKKILNSSISLIQKNVAEDFEARITVDSAPVMEKYWAVSCGLGWQGKNSNIINRNFGSFFFIAELICNIDFPADGPVQDMCGSCSKCIDACPTGAIVEPRVVDSRKCLSYQTIESKNLQWPEDLSENHSECVFGCDICQDVCPWNKFSVHLTVPELEKREFNDLDHPLYWFMVNEDEFKIRFRGSAVLRAGYKKYYENLKVVWLDREKKQVDNAIAIFNSYSDFLMDLSESMLDPGLFYKSYLQWLKNNSSLGSELWENWKDYMKMILSIYSEHERSRIFEIDPFSGKQFTKSMGFSLFGLCEWISAKLNIPQDHISDSIASVHKGNFLSFCWIISLYLCDWRISHFDQLGLYQKFLLNFQSKISENGGRIEHKQLKDIFNKLGRSRPVILLGLRN